MFKSHLIPGIASQGAGLLDFFGTSLLCISYGNKAVQRPGQLLIPAGCFKGALCAVM